MQISTRGRIAAYRFSRKVGSERHLRFISLLGSFVGGIFIAPERQGLGVGRRLIADAFARTGELSLEVYTENEQAVRFYSRIGFREVSRRDIDDSGFPFPNATLILKG